MFKSNKRKGRWTLSRVPSESKHAVRQLGLNGRRIEDTYLPDDGALENNEHEEGEETVISVLVKTKSDT